MRITLTIPLPSSRSLVALLALLLAPALTPQPSQRIAQFENDQARVWKSIVQPNAPLALHRHDHPRVIIPLTSGTMKFIDQAGNAEMQTWEAGHAYWSPAMAPGALHADVNAGKEPIAVMVVELLKEK